MEDKFFSKIKHSTMQKTPQFYEFLRYVFGAVFVGKDVVGAIKEIPLNSKIINLGSGAKKVRKDVINVDIFPSARVDVVADAKNLPFANDSMDAAIAEQLLEHVSDPQKVVDEIYRVLKPGGTVYISTPFMIGYHSMPNDYYRWTLDGLKELMKNFKESESGMRCGPTSALVAILSEWLASFLSFGIKFLYQIFLPVFILVLAPLKILDFFIYRYKSFDKIALAFYFVGKK